VSSGSVPTLIVLAGQNRLLIIQNETLKKLVVLELSNLNMVEVLISQTNLNKSRVEEAYGFKNVLDDLMNQKRMRSSQKGLAKTTNSRKSSKHEVRELEFSCICASRKGFLLGGSNGSIVNYDLEKSLALTNTMSFEMKLSSGEDIKLFSISSSFNDSIISLSAYESQGYINFYILNTYQLDSEVPPI